MEDVEMLNQ